jgi:hypothetical protein
MEKGNAAYQEQIRMFAADVLPKLKFSHHICA